MADDIELSFDDTFEDTCVDSDYSPSRSNSIKGKKGGGLDSQRRKEKRRSKVRNKKMNMCIKKNVYIKLKGNYYMNRKNIVNTFTKISFS